jgi:predicted alpha/beta superfamily hydrolase
MPCNLYRATAPLALYIGCAELDARRSTSISNNVQQTASSLTNVATLPLAARAAFQQPEHWTHEGHTVTRPTAQSVCS